MTMSLVDYDEVSVPLYASATCKCKSVFVFVPFFFNLSACLKRLVTQMEGYEREKLC
jgi:hypothetical protein